MPGGSFREEAVPVALHPKTPSVAPLLSVRFEGSPVLRKGSGLWAAHLSWVPAARTLEALSAADADVYLPPRDLLGLCCPLCF